MVSDLFQNSTKIFIQLQQTYSHSTNIFIQLQQTHSHSTNIFIQLQQTHSYSTNIFIQLQQTYSYSTNIYSFNFNKRIHIQQICVHSTKLQNTFSSTKYLFMPARVTQPARNLIMQANQSCN